MEQWGGLGNARVRPGDTHEASARTRAARTGDPGYLARRGLCLGWADLARHWLCDLRLSTCLSEPLSSCVECVAGSDCAGLSGALNETTK